MVPGNAAWSYVWPFLVPPYVAGLLCGRANVAGCSSRPSVLYAGLPTARRDSHNDSADLPSVAALPTLHQRRLLDSMPRMELSYVPGLLDISRTDYKPADHLRSNAAPDFHGSASSTVRGLENNARTPGRMTRACCEPGRERADFGQCEAAIFTSDCAALRHALRRLRTRA